MLFSLSPGFAISRSEQVRRHIAGYGDIAIEHGGLPRGHVGAQVDKALILYQPGVPAGARIAGVADGPMAVGNRMSGIGHVAVEVCRRSFGRVEGKRAAAVQVKLSRRDALARRPLVVLN